MRFEVTHKSVVALAIGLLALSAACGGTQQPEPAPTPDIEATVAARITEKQAEDPALEAMVKAMVEATTQAGPATTPVSPSPASKATPVPSASKSVPSTGTPAATKTPIRSAVQVSPTPTLTPALTLVPSTPTLTPTPTLVPPTPTLTPTPTLVPPTPTLTPTPTLVPPTPAADRAYNTGTEYLEQGQYSQAIEEFNEAVWRDPRKAEAYYSRAFAYAELGQYEQAIQDLDEAIRLNPNDTDSYQLRGQTYQILGLFKEAERDLARARAEGNLVPYAPSGWEAPLVVSRDLCSVENNDLSPDEDTFIDWAVGYTGRSQSTHIFYTDLLFDGVVVTRWTGNDLDSSKYSVIEQWEKLSQQTRVAAGEHTLSLQVDSTNLVAETNEDDNIFTQCFTWATAEHEPITPQDLSRAPDLVPFAAQGWSDPIVVTSHQGVASDGPLSVDVPSRISYSVQNQGLSSTSERFWVYLYLDDILVYRGYWDGMLVEHFGVNEGWSELSNRTNVVRGIHTLKVVVDATDLVVESDEGNNVFEKQFTWGSGPVTAMPISTPTPIPTPPAPMTLPNLVPGWPFGQDGPIIVSREEGTSLDSLVTADGTFFVDVAVSNRSIVEAPPFAVDLYIDGEKVDKFDFGELQGGWYVGWEDWSPQNQQAQMAEGSHTLTLVIDPTDAVQEANEDDNVYEKTVIWSGPDATAEQGLTVYTNEELQQVLSNLQRVLDIRDDALTLSGTDHTDDVLSVAEAGYYLITGKSLQDERVDILLLTHDGYLEWIDKDYSETFASSEESEYSAILARREKIKTEATGYTTRHSGRVAVVVDAERPVAEVINTLAHELGHMRQQFLNPAQSVVDNFYTLSGIREAQAQQFERAIWLALEDFTNLSLMAYPNFEKFHELIDHMFQTWEEERDSGEHSLGSLLQWLVVLDDPKLSDLRIELVKTGRLGAESSLQLYDYLVALAPEVIDSYVSDRLDSIEEWRPTILEVSKLRLVPLHELQIEGAAALQEPALGAP